MTDLQIFTLAMSVLIPLSLLLLSNSKAGDLRDALRASISETRESLRGSIAETKDTLRAEIRAGSAELRTEFTKSFSEISSSLQRIENKIDHIAETVADHRVRLDKLDGGKTS